MGFEVSGFYNNSGRQITAHFGYLFATLKKNKL